MYLQYLTCESICILKQSNISRIAILLVLCTSVAVLYDTSRMVKCAAFNCRSGYRAKKGVLKTGKLTACRRSVFRFPKDPVRKAQWISVLRRGDTGWNPEHCGVCDLHFREDDFCQETRRKDERKRKFLKRDAVPSVFDAYPE